VHYIKKFGVALAVLALVGASVAAMASGADPLFLEFTKGGFTISGGKGELTTEGNPFGIKCESVKGSGEITSPFTDVDTFKNVTFDFEGCNANSLGDAAKVILFKAAGELCIIKETAPLEIGMYIEATENVHVENVPIAGLVVFEKGSSDVGAVTPINVKTKSFTVKLTSSGTGVQTVKKCTGLVLREPSIKAKIAESATNTPGSITTEATVTTEVEGKIDG
jgi:hypothetical protein